MHQIKNIGVHLALLKPSRLGQIPSISNQFVFIRTSSTASSCRRVVVVNKVSTKPVHLCASLANHALTIRAGRPTAHQTLPKLPKRRHPGKDDHRRAHAHRKMIIFPPARTYRLSSARAHAPENDNLIPSPLRSHPTRRKSNPPPYQR